MFAWQIKRDERQMKPRKEIQKRSFWRRFFSSFLSLLKEKRPPEANKRKRYTGGQGRPPYGAALGKKSVITTIQIFKYKENLL